MSNFPRVSLVVAIASLLLACEGRSALAQVQQSAVSATAFTDRIKKGKNDLDNFAYASAIQVWSQLLAQPLSRHQRIDALQLLAATLYPDDRDAQKADSASSVIRQLVSMGIRKMVLRDVTHPGLDSLYRTVVGSVGPAAPTVFDSVRNVVALVSDGYESGDILDRVAIDCYSFSFADLTTGLRGRSAYAGLPDALKRTCSQLFVESEPPNSNLTIGTRDFGNVPERGQWRWVMPEQSIEIAVARGQRKSSTVVEFPRGRLVTARFSLARDTLPWPEVKTPIQIAEELRILNGFRPSTPAPALPVRPKGGGAARAGALWGLVGGVTGFAVGQFISAAGCNVNETIPPGVGAKRDGKFYAPGETINLGAGMPCTATLAGGAFLGVFTVASIMKSSRNRSAMSKFNIATREYPTLQQEWQDRERLAFANSNPDVRRAISDQQARLQQTQAENAQIRTRNGNLPQPVITLRELNPSPGSSPPPERE